MIHDPEGRINLQPTAERVRVGVGNDVIADTTAAIELRETGYPARQYIPREDVDMDRLVPSSTVTHCPFKGDAHYFSLEVAGKHLPDAVWSYETPFDAVADIAGHLAFDSRVVEERIGDA